MIQYPENFYASSSSNTTRSLPENRKIADWYMKLIKMAWLDTDNPIPESFLQKD